MSELRKEHIDRHKRQMNRLKLKIKIICIVLFMFTRTNSFAQLDYNLMGNWAFHPTKSGTLIDGYNLDIAVIDENLNTDIVFQMTNNAMTNTGVDVFFVHPTILSDLWGYTTRVNIPLNDQPSWLISASILGQAGLLSKYGRFFAPRYRQASPPTYLGSALDSTQAAVIGEAYKDIKASFLHYLNNYNNGNKIILASHSQGAYLTAMLLRDVFDTDTDLQNKLVTAVIAGVVNSYAEPFQFTGGWWQNIPFCTTMNQCNCVMTWRSYKEGQSLPPPSQSLPCLNPYLEDSDYVYRLLDVNQDWINQDSIYYSNQAKPLRYYLIPKTDQPYGGVAGFIAFDSLYNIRYQREGALKVGFKVEHNPKQNDQRPDDLQEQETNPLFNYLGYHNKDYNIYQWALIEQIDMKLAACGSLSRHQPDDKHAIIQMFPNPNNDRLNIKSEKEIIQIQIFSANGRLIKTVNPKNKDFSISINDISAGLYFVKVDLSNGSSWTGKLIKE